MAKEIPMGIFLSRLLMLGLLKVLWILLRRLRVKLEPRGNPEEIDPEISYDFMRTTGMLTLGAVVQDTPIDTGELALSWDLDVTPRGFTVGSRSSYAAYPEFGTSGPIRPKRAQNLVFRSKGKLYFLKEVAGQRAQLFVLGALQKLFPGANITRK